MKNFLKSAVAGAILLVAHAVHAQQYAITIPALNSYGPWYALSNSVTVPTNTTAGVQIGTNVTTLTPIMPLKPFVSVGVWVNATGGGTGTSNLYANFGVTYGNVGTPPGTPFSGTNLWSSAYGTNVTTYSKNLQVPVVLNASTNVLGFGVLSYTNLYGARGLQLIGFSTDATNAVQATVTNVVVSYFGP